MKSGWTKILAGFLILVLIVGLAGVIRQQMDYRKGDADYSEAEELAGVFVPEGTAVTGADGGEAEKDPAAAALETIDLDALREVNPDVAGWICIPGTKISYPWCRPMTTNIIWIRPGKGRAAPWEPFSWNVRSARI